MHAKLAELPIDLVSAPPPAVAYHETVAVARPPRTGVVGAARSAARSALGATPAERVRHLGADDILVLAQPDATVGTSTDRPELAIDGPARRG